MTNGPITGPTGGKLTGRIAWRDPRVLLSAEIRTSPVHAERLAAAYEAGSLKIRDALQLVERLEMLVPHGFRVSDVSLSLGSSAILVDLAFEPGPSGEQADLDEQLARADHPAGRALDTVPSVTTACAACGAFPGERHADDCPVYLANLRSGH